MTPCAACRIDRVMLDEQHGLEGGYITGRQIIFCPLHQAAEPLREAADYALRLLTFQKLTDDTLNRVDAVQKLRAALDASGGRDEAKRQEQEATMRRLRCPDCGVPHETSQECPD